MAAIKAKVERGDYLVDDTAVADAILRRLRGERQGRLDRLERSAPSEPLQGVLEAAQ